MSTTTETSTTGRSGSGGLRASVFNLPNQLTWMRLALAIVMFALLSVGPSLDQRQVVYYTAMALFLIAAATDWLDGYLARKYGLITTLGRILDPFADKVIVCGTFVFLAAIPGSAVTAWMAVVVLGREILVTALRSFLEQRGADFSATFSGKLKMVLQCVAVTASLFTLGYSAGVVSAEETRAKIDSVPGGFLDGMRLLELAGAPAWMGWVLCGSVALAVILTVISGLAYVRSAIAQLRDVW